MGDRYFGRTEGEGEDMLGHLMEAKDRDGGRVSFLDILKDSNILGAGNIPILFHCPHISPCMQFSFPQLPWNIKHISSDSSLVHPLILLLLFSGGYSNDQAPT